VKTDFLFADVSVNVYYTTKETEKSAAQIEALVRDKIKQFQSTYLNKFNATLRLSKLSKEIDSLDNSIQSNSILAKPIIEFSPTINIVSNPRFVFGAELIRPYAYNNAEGFTNYKPAVVSSVFDQNGTCMFFQDDGKGAIQIVTDDRTNPQVVNPNAGTVNYQTGEVKLTNFETESYPGAAIKIYANTKQDDIKTPSGRVFLIKDEDVRVNVYVDGVFTSTATTTTDPATVTVPAGTSVLVTGTGAGTGSSGGAGGGYVNYGS
jgi:hypothetical protein